MLKVTDIPNFYDKYKDRHVEIKKACVCVDENKCENLSDNILEINQSINKIGLTSWNDKLGSEFRKAKTSCATALTEIISSIDSSFKSSENKYHELDTSLDSLKGIDDSLSLKKTVVPNQTQYQMDDYYTTELGERKLRKIDDVASFNRAYRAWSNEVSDLITDGETLVELIEEDFSVLDTINNTTLSKLDEVGVATTLENMFYLANPDAKKIVPPTGLGTDNTMMAWQMVRGKNSDHSNQLALRIATGQHFDERGFARIDGRYVVAMTDTFGNVGDYVDVHFNNGVVIKAVIGDQKSRTVEAWDPDPANEWGHDDGKRMVEFIVDGRIWYGEHNGKGHNLPNPGSGIYQEEFGNREGVDYVINLGRNYFDENDIDRTGYVYEDLPEEMGNW